MALAVVRLVEEIVYDPFAGVELPEFFPECFIEDAVIEISKRVVALLDRDEIYVEESRRKGYLGAVFEDAERPRIGTAGKLRPMSLRGSLPPVIQFAKRRRSLAVRLRGDDGFEDDRKSGFDAKSPQFCVSSG